MALIGIVSWVVRSLLGGIQNQLLTLSGQLTIVTSARGDTMREVQEMISEGRRGTDERIERLTRAVELAARADLLRLIGSPQVSNEVKDQARHIVEEIANGGAR